LHWTTHIIAGAAMGYLVGNPHRAALLGIASHIVLDVAPHYDPDSEIGYVLDSAAGCATLACIAFNRKIRRADADRAALYGAIGSALPDVELLRKLFRDVRSEEYIFPAHDGTLPHHQTHFAGSSILQLTLILVLLALVARKAGKSQKVKQA
jgi:hypothetical protein